MNKENFLIFGALEVIFFSGVAFFSGCDKTDNVSVKRYIYNHEIINTNLDKIDMKKWRYNSDDDVYYQIGINYCKKPINKDYETLAIFVPGAYMTREDNSDGTFSCKLNLETNINGYTTKTAPIIIPVETPGYSAQAALKEYIDPTNYTKSGFVYVYAGCRGRESGAPAGVTDLKAAIRYLRYTKDIIAGNIDRIFVCGMSGGGAQSALLGSTGDSELYEPYLNQIGAVKGVSDSVLGSMSWCPITNLDSANMAYEWMMGQTRSELSDEEKKISDELAAYFADYINLIKIKDERWNILTLEKSDDGIYQAGSYYDYIKEIIEKSLNNFLVDTKFPYDASLVSKESGMGGFETPNNMRLKPGDDKPENFNDDNYERKDNIMRNKKSDGLILSGTYEAPSDYIKALNQDSEWVTYDEKTNTAKIKSISEFVKAMKNASKGLGAFDQLDKGQGENILFGYGDGTGAHFDSVLAVILKKQNNKYAADYLDDLTKKDTLGNKVDKRLNMYSPLYYLLESQAGYKKSKPAKYWRIRSGISQSDTSLTTEVNLALALKNYDEVKNIDFETVWGRQHEKAERTGSSTENFINWVNECLSE